MPKAKVARDLIRRDVVDAVHKSPENCPGDDLFFAGHEGGLFGRMGNRLVIEP